jgi:methyl-accepting chemotaxis protein
MFNSKLKAELQACQVDLVQQRAFFDAIKGNMAMITFTPEGVISDVNALFLSVLGYGKHDVEGKHHRIFCDNQYVQSTAYAQFWERLRHGHAHSGVFPRLNKQGQQIWLEATYFPVKLAGKVVQVVKIAADVTQRYKQRLSQQAELAAFYSSSAMIEFTPKGEIVTANQNFLSCLGYSLTQLSGQHHRLFCDDSFYQEHPHFWDELAKGRTQAGLFMRRDSHGNAVWLEATYNPIKDEAGKVIKVIKLANEVSERIRQAQAGQ